MGSMPATFKRASSSPLSRKIDGKTSGPKGFTGPIGKRLSTCEKLPVVGFEAIESDLTVMDNVTSVELSTDQKYLHAICRAVATGDCPTNVAELTPGHLHHGRWLTTACRILRLYVATVDPSQELRILATFVMRVYAPMWFQIKTHPSLKYAAANLWRTIVASRYLTGDHQQIVQSVIQTNGYWAHPESILVGMLNDDRDEICQNAATLILKAREMRKVGIRKFTVPAINFKANDYVQLVDWSSCDVTEPPLTMSLTQEDLQNIASGDKTPLSSLQELFDLPCHTQAVERCVKEVTSAAEHVVGHDVRDGFIRARLMDRKIMPSFESKCQFKTQ